MPKSIRAISRTSELPTTSTLQPAFIQAKTSYNVLKTWSLQPIKSFHTTKTVWSMRPSTVELLYKFLSKKIDQSPSFCRAIIDNLNSEAMGRISRKFKSKQDKKEKNKHSFNSFSR